MVGAVGIGIGFFIFEPWLDTRCGSGFGEAHPENGVELLKYEFREPLPSNIQLLSFECRGFQDLSLEAEFLLEKADGLRLLSGLEEVMRVDQHHELFEDHKKTRREHTDLAERVVSFRLPSFGALHVREVTLRWPLDGDGPWHVGFVGYQF